jgi:hypothetical protein
VRFVGIGGAGSSLTAAGDTNGDGDAEIAIADDDTNIIYVVTIDDSLDDTSFATIDLASSDFVVATVVGVGDVGAAMAGGADIDGDGADDLVVGAPKYGSNAGRAYILYGLLD